MTLGAIGSLAAACLSLPANAQDRGVGCVVSQLAPDRLQVLSRQNFAAEISVEAIGEELRPAIRACIDNGTITAQPQVDASFGFAMAMLDLFAAGEQLQAAGLDPSAVERLWDGLTPALAASLMANARDPAAPFPQAELAAFESANSEADERGKLGTALSFLSALARDRAAEAEFDEARAE